MNSPILIPLGERLGRIPDRHTEPHGLPQAAVLVALTNTQRPQVILTRRAAHLSSHPGQVAFPGGRRDPGDRDPVQTALRESEEEIGLPPEQVRLLGQLKPLISRHGLWVTPVVGVIPDQLPLQANPDETQAIYRVPLDFLAETQPSRIDHLVHEHEDHSSEWFVPAWYWKDLEIWGFSAIVLCELLNLSMGTSFDLHQPVQVS